MPLGLILVQEGFVEDRQLRLALHEMGGLWLHCPECDSSFRPDAFDADGDNLCPSCQSPAEFDDQTLSESQTRSATRVTQSQTRRANSPSVSQGGRHPSSTSGLRASEPESCIGKILGGCEIVAKVAQGGMGIVYKATQLNLGRTVAVKILSEDLAKDSSFVRRFLQEARAAAQLNHGNIVHVNDVGEYQGMYYFVMEFVDGENLREVLKRERQLPVYRALEITEEVCEALGHAHQRGIIHRDIKPENIMITPEGGVKLADLGLAKRVDSEGRAGITHTGSILGTPYYMAPEQAKDFSQVDGRSDIYSLGVTLYRMIAGKVPFNGRSPVEVMIKAIDGGKVPIRELRDDVPAAVEEIVDRMMHPDPALRFQQIEEVKDVVRRVIRLLTVAQSTS